MSTPEQTPTPRTDAAEDEYRRGSNDWTVELNKVYSFARELERELTAAQSKLLEHEQTSVRVYEETQGLLRRFDEMAVEKNRAIDAQVLAESNVFRLEAKCKETARDFETAFRVVRQENDRLTAERDAALARVAELEEFLHP